VRTVVAVKRFPPKFCNDRLIHLFSGFDVYALWVGQSATASGAAAASDFGFGSEAIDDELLEYTRSSSEVADLLWDAANLLNIRVSRRSRNQFCLSIHTMRHVVTHGTQTTAEQRW
jgi:hypothetical protein